MLNKIKPYLILSAILFPNIVFACLTEPSPIYLTWKTIESIISYIALPLLIVAAIFLHIKKSKKKKILFFLILLLIPVLIIQILDLTTNKKTDVIKGYCPSGANDLSSKIINYFSK